MIPPESVPLKGALGRRVLQGMVTWEAPGEVLEAVPDHDGSRLELDSSGVPS